MIELFVKNPKNPSQTKLLTDDQASIVYQYVVNSINENQGRGIPKDSMIIKMLEEAGKPVKFD
jgi:hypothetical protein